ncbi:hypothetical protein [Thermobrachium celere]|uniref:hypothetical protein n=1 Tax=Thermobrachium celere TaxID=53422 RepID=UPI00194317E5|nr:hypothetical protein [Thermobrachium celere]GFR36592.1 hypothetical protein TCEA9_24040 [Thermobrachium celere]
MVLKFQLKSWNNVKKLLLLNLPLDSQEIRKLEEIIAKRDVDKINRFIETVCSTYKLTPNFKNNLMKKVIEEVEYLKSIKGVGAYERLTKKMFTIKRNTNFNRKRILPREAYELFINFLVSLESLDFQKEVKVSDIKRILTSSVKVNSKALEKYKNLALNMEEENVYTYSGDKKIMDIVNVLSALQDRGIINKIEKLIYINRRLDDNIKRYIDQKISKIYIPLSDDEVMDYVLDDIKGVYKAIIIHYVYNILCNICYEAATSFAVIVVS